MRDDELRESWSELADLLEYCSLPQFSGRRIIITCAIRVLRVAITANGARAVRRVAETDE